MQIASRNLNYERNKNKDFMIKALAINKRAKYDYNILETFEAGLVLNGHEVKSIKTGHISLKGAYIVIKNNEAFLINANIPSFQSKNVPEDYDPDRTKKLLLRKQEIKSLIGRSKEQGLTLVPIKVYTKKSKIKLEFGIGHGKKKIDKRELIKKREAKREIEKRLKEK